MIHSTPKAGDQLQRPQIIDLDGPRASQKKWIAFQRFLGGIGLQKGELFISEVRSGVTSSTAAEASETSKPLLPPCAGPTKGRRGRVDPPSAVSRAGRELEPPGLSAWSAYCPILLVVSAVQSRRVARRATQREQQVLPFVEPWRITDFGVAGWWFGGSKGGSGSPSTSLQQHPWQQGSCSS